MRYAELSYGKKKLAMDKEQILLAEYTEVCKTYHAISDFRGKLLALLPIVSGAGISLLISKNHSPDSSHLLAVGIFGVLVTLGLFFYELRGIQKCKSLIILGGKIESELKIELGQFRRSSETDRWFYRRGDSGLGNLHGRIGGLALRCVGRNLRAALN